MYSARDRTGSPKRLKIAPTALPTIAGNASTAFLESLLIASSNLSNHFFRAPLTFDGVPSVLHSPVKTRVIARTVIEMVIQKAIRIENMVIPCSRNKVRILSAKDVF